jgi:flavin reductase (DIM6/NTAB) family NADH-FMN oxidoreductase RutF
MAGVDDILSRIEGARMDLRPNETPHRDFYRLLITAVAPRPIAWVSTVSKNGDYNLAPYSFFNALCATPPLLGFCPGIRASELTDALGTGVKDTLRNVRETGEFVINVVTYTLAEQMNVTSGEYEADVDEFAVAKLTTRASQVVRPPQVAESPINFECKLFEILDFGTEKAGGSLVIGEIVCVHVAEQVLRNGRIDASLLDLVGRLGGSQYTQTRERFEMGRPGLKLKQ